MQANWSMKPSILLVDDVPANLRTLTDLLSAHYRLRFANSGLQTLQLLQTDPLPDLILLDVMMPDMDGYAVCREIKRWVTTQHIPVIFLTALDEDNDEMLGLEVGADDFITKPFKPEIVLARIRNLLRRHARVKPLSLESDAPKTNSLIKKGQTWHISFQGNPTFYLPDRQGLAYLKFLLMHPGQEFAVEEIVFLLVPKERERILNLASERIGIQQTKLLDVCADNACTMLGLSNQKKTNTVIGVSPEQLSTMLREERVFENDPVVDTVNRERFRKSVSIALRRTLEDISKFDPSLANHLQAPNLRMGFKLLYAPHPELSWIT